MKKTALLIDEETARKEYPSASDVIKKILESSYPDGFFKLTIEERTPDFEAAHVIFLTKKFTDHDLLILQRRKVEDMTAIDMLAIIANVLQEDWEADYDNSSQEKYYGWLQKTAAGWVFDGTYYERTVTSATVGPRFAQETEEQAKYLIEQFIAEWNEYHTIG